MRRNQLLHDADAYTTADVIDRIEPPKLADMNLKAYMRDRAMRGEAMSPAMNEALERTPEGKANIPWLAAALQAAERFSPEAMAAANFVGHRVPLRGALDRSPEARLARARELGFDVDNPLYVSALQPMDEFMPHGKFMGHKGISGISLADSPELASRYLDRYGDFNYKGEPFNKNMMKVYARKGETREFSKPLYDGVPTGNPLPENYSWPRSLEGVDTAVFPDSITRRGDVAHYPPNQGRPVIEGKEYILRDPSRVRSVNAMFDPRRINSRNLMAGLAGAAVIPGTVVGAGLNQLLQD